MNPQIKNRKRIIAAALAIVLLLFFYFLSSSRPGNSSSLANQGTLTLNYGPSVDLSKASVEVNGKAVAGKDKLSAGNYHLNVSEQGYQTFSQQFSIVAGQTTYITVNLKPSSQPSASNLSAIVINQTGSGPENMASFMPAGTTVENVAYFDNNSWAIIKLDLKTGEGIVYFIAQYNPSTGLWSAVTSPGDELRDQNSSSLPVDVQNYIQTNYGTNG